MVLAHDEISLTNKEYMSREDGLDATSELEHFYTSVKNHYSGDWVPSAMVDKAWHHHILNIQMVASCSGPKWGTLISEWGIR
ncbi:unnamed protein product [Rotaria socialis]